MPVEQRRLVRFSLAGVPRKTYGRNLPETSPGVEPKVRIRCGPLEIVTLQDSGASISGHRGRAARLAGRALSGQSFSRQVLVPSALAGRPSGLPRQVKADKIVPALNLKS